jgi:guanylate kinase
MNTIKSQAGKGGVCVVTGPLASGKSTTLQHFLKEKEKPVSFVVPCTTRAPEPGEVDGVHRYFISEEVFSEMVKHENFFHTMEAPGFREGLAKNEVIRNLESGVNILIDIDVKGALALQKQDNPRLRNATYVFMLPEKRESMIERIKKMCTGFASVGAFVEKARKDLELAVHFNNQFVITDNVDDDVRRFKEFLEQHIVRPEQLAVRA